MRNTVNAEAKVLWLPNRVRPRQSSRKTGINQNREGSVRSVNGTVYVDFYYMGERVRENTGLPCTRENKGKARKQLDRIIMARGNGEFQFAEMFPESKKKDLFTRLEREKRTDRQEPRDILCRDYFEKWRQDMGVLENVTGRTLLGYDSQVRNYLDRRTFIQGLEKMVGGGGK